MSHNTKEDHPIKPVVVVSILVLHAPVQQAAVEHDGVAYVVMQFDVDVILRVFQL